MDIKEIESTPEKMKLNEIITAGETLIESAIYNNRSELDLRDVDLSKYSIDEKMSVYRGCQYLGYRDNPYFVLVSAIPDQNNDVFLHPDTCGLCNTSFYSEKPYYIQFHDKSYPVHSLTLNRLVVNEKMNSYFCGFIDVKCNFCEVYTDSKFLLQNRMDLWAKNAKRIYAPKYKITEFKGNEIKPNLVAGFLSKYEECVDISDEVKNSYVKFISSRYKELCLHITEYPEILDYLIDNKILKDEDYARLNEATQGDLNLSNKIKEYYNDITAVETINACPDWRMLLREDFRAEEGIDFSARVIPPDNWKGETLKRHYFLDKLAPEDLYYYDTDMKRDLPDCPISIRNKMLTFISKFLNVGDIFVGRYKNETIRIELCSKSSRYDCRANFKICEISKKETDSDCSSIGNVPAIVDNKLEVAGNNQSLILKSIYLQNRMYSDCRIALYPHLGLFKNVRYGDKPTEVQVFLNSNDFILDKKLLELFEPYFYLPVPNEISDSAEQEYIFFRKDIDETSKVEEKDYYKILCRTLDDLIVDIYNYRCAAQKPFQVIENIDKEKYVTAEGKEFDLKELILLVNSIIVVKNRDVNELMVLTYIRQYKNHNGADYSILSSCDIHYLLDTYFHINLYGGFYVGYDSYFTDKSNLCFFEGKWLKCLYSILRKYKDKQFAKCSELLPFIPKTEQKYFSLFTIPLVNCASFFCVAQHCNTYEVFIQVIKSFLVNS